MTTKVTLSSPPVQLQDLGDSQDGFQMTPQEVHHQDFVQPGDTQANVTTKRPPTPPKPKHTHASWNQTRLSKQKESGNGYYSRSPEPSQQPNSGSNSSRSGKDKKTPTVMKSQAAAYDYDHQQYLYHQQALQAESNKDFPPSYPKKHLSGHMDEYFMIQEQLDRTNRERDYLIEENTQLKYHLQMLQYRVQNVEHIWQAYYAQMMVGDKKHQQRHSWASIHSSTATQQRQQQQQQQQQSKRHQYPYSPSYQPDYFAGPVSMPPPPPPLPLQLPHFGPIPAPPIIDLSPNRSFPERNSRHFQQQQGDAYPRFRRHRSKSLPRKTSVPDDDHHGSAPYPVEQPMLFPPPMLPLVPNPMIASPFPPPPPRQAFTRSSMVPSLQSKRYSHLQENNHTSDTEGGHSDSDLDDDDDDDDGNNNRRRRQQLNNGSPMLPFLPPPFYSSSFPPFRYPHQQNSNASLPRMDSGRPYDEEDNWDQRPMAPPLDRIYNNPTSIRTAYHRDEGMMRPDPFVKTAHPAKQPSFYNDHQPSYASPHRHPY